jgi:N-acetylglucosamine-6-sulfatase
VLRLRTTILAALGVGGLIAGLGPWLAEVSRAAPSGGRPNIVLVMTDDQAISQMSGEVMPRISKYLGNRGTQFDHAYLTTPLCCPSRATLLTGQYGHNNGVLRNAYPALNYKRNVLPVWLRRSGYRTIHIGKFLNAYGRGDAYRPAPGWSEWHTMIWKKEVAYYDYNLSVNGRRVHHGHDPSDYSPHVFLRTAERLLHRYAPRRRPLYLELDEPTPHPIRHGVPLSDCNPPPDPRDEGRFKDAQLPRPPSFDETDMADKPSFMRALPPLTRNQIDRMTRRYRCSLEALHSVDRTIGRLIKELKQLGEFKRTVFIFYTDNGTFYGEHRIYGGKLNPYEEAASTPLFMRVPARYLHGSHPVAHVTQPVANIDFAPTIRNLAHAEPCRAPRHCRRMDGRSLLGLIAGKDPPWAENRPIGIELHETRSKERHGVCLYKGVRVSGQVLIRHIKIRRPGSRRCDKINQWERYDLRSDPYELHNLCFGGDQGSCPHNAFQQRLYQVLARMKDCEGIAGRDPRPRSGHYCG